MGDLTRARLNELEAKEKRLDELEAKAHPLGVDKNMTTDSDKKAASVAVKEVNLKPAADAAEKEITEDKTNTFKCGACGAQTKDIKKCDNCGVDFV